MQETIDEQNEVVLKKLLHSTTSSLSCTICQELMFQPFLINCGHSFCYSCLKEWFKNRPVCPMCRSKVKRPPSLNITLREIVNGFVTILNTEQLTTQKNVSLKEYEGDLNDHNLFNRAFYDLIETTLDRSDGVPRCSRCLWEAHGSSCMNCGATFIDDHENDSDEGEDLYFSDFDVEQDEMSQDDDEQNNESGDGSSFLDDRNLSEIDGELTNSDLGLSDEDEYLHGSSPQWPGHVHDVDEEDDSSSYEDLDAAIRRVNEDVHLIDSDEDSDELGTRRVRRTRIIDSDDD